MPTITKKTTHNIESHCLKLFRFIGQRSKDDKSSEGEKFMDWEKYATTGVIVKPQIFSVFGPNGVGKTTLGCAFGDAMIIDLEDGSRNIAGVKRYPKEAFPKFQSFKDFLFHLLGSSSKEQTLVIDSLEALEDLISSHVCEDAQVDSIEKAYGGFGKGMVRMREIMGDVMRTLQMIRDRRDMNIVIVAHSQMKPHTDPVTNQTYDRITIRANDKFAAVVKDLSDTILFIKPKVYTEASKNNPSKMKATSLGERVIHTAWSAAFDAKSRYSLPVEITYTLETLPDVVKILKGSEAEVLEKEIYDLLPLVADSDKAKAAVTKLKEACGDVLKLRAIRDRIMEITNK
jgi:hypothetical protein